MTTRLGWIGGMTVAVLVGALPASAGAAAGGYLQENLSLRPARGGPARRTRSWSTPGGCRAAQHAGVGLGQRRGRDELYNGACPGTPRHRWRRCSRSASPRRPTGQVFNDTTAFQLPGMTTAARFIFLGEDGDLSAWAGGPAATLVGHRAQT